MYIPRGVIHQAKATKEFSTHLTMSTYQAQSWGDMLEAALPAALSRAMDQSVDFRRGLPLRVFDQLGAASGGVERDALDKARRVVASLMVKLVEFVDFSGAIDSMHYEFMARRLDCAPSDWDLAGEREREREREGEREREREREREKECV